ncbi:MAG TPA: L,D-transpeptidase [Tepidisphaeraceae bacterium]|jgi:lipoprotein-anchoring transpeptidase ErfK/SrfK|nr:L,D-transpeptidase [Tepidisphaeraceae bacterium]
MMIRIALVALLVVASSAMAEVKLDAATREALGWQIALEREGFSPGIIDGKSGAKCALATAEFQRRMGLNPTGALDAATREALIVGVGEPFQYYTVAAPDVSQVTGTIPQDWNIKSKMQFLGYASVADAVAERFHCTRGLLERLNPGANFAVLKEGDVLVVPAIEKGKMGRGSRLQIHLGQKVIRALDREGKVIALFHCSIAKDEAKRPTGVANVVSVTSNPIYRFDPAMWPEVKNVNQKLLIPPGPRNPVGVCWIALSLPGYGIHGTPTPEMIGKTGSHGCFRLTNWDSARLGGMVSEGMIVEFVGR